MVREADSTARNLGVGAPCSFLPVRLEDRNIVTRETSACTISSAAIAVGGCNDEK